jgi:gliding motility-associated-like protein
MLGTDTVYAITWGATAPEQIKVRRYSGVAPGGIAAGKKYMYFYTSAEVTGSGADNFALQQFYLDPWRGLIAKETDIRLGKTDAAGSWLVDTASRVQTEENIITQPRLHYLARFTGLTDSTVKTAPEAYLPADTSNMGTRFWVGYGHNSFFDTPNEHEMALYFSTRDSANVTVRINGTTWQRQYHIAPNSSGVSDLIPKQGMTDARLTAEGWFDKGISIESDVPIAAYAHIYGLASSGATMLLPVGTYGYEYYALAAPQTYTTANCYSWFYVVADHDSTLVEITPSCTTVGGHAAGVPFNVLLNRGEIYQVLGALQPGSLEAGYEVTGSRVKSIGGPSGKCYPIGVFSGSGRTSLSCDGQGTSGDNMIQQNFPYQAWGNKYLTAPVPSPYDPETPTDNLYRVLVKDPATKVMKNGVLMTGMDTKGYYEYYSHEADYIQADQPIVVAQYMLSDGACGVSYEYGDPEMIYLSPLEQGIKQTSFYRTRNFRVRINYLVVTIPDEGLKTLLIDGNNAFDYTYAHPGLPGYTVVIKRWTARAVSSTVSSDVAFTAVTYGLGEQESYGYNAGTQVRNLNPVAGFVNVYDSSGSNSAYTCAGTPFRFTLLLPVKPTEISWGFSTVAQLSPNADSVQINPVPADSVIVAGRKLYRYSVNQSYTVTAQGTYTIPVVYKHPDIQSCNQSAGASLVITVLKEPVCDFSVAYSGCLSDVARFAGSATGVNGGAVNVWKWDFDDNTGSGAKDTVKQFNAPGIYEVKLKAIGVDGCVADTMKRVEALAYAALNFVNDTVRVCAAASAVLEIKNPETGITYNWYDAPSAGTQVTSGSSYTVASVTDIVSYYVAAVKNSCASPREPVTAVVLQKLALPVITVDSVGVNLVRFTWNSVPGAIAYEVSVDGGVTWITPSSGSTGLAHLITGLRSGQEVTLLVKAKGGSACQDRQSEKAAATTLPDQVFIPNSFSPNGDGLNDVIRVYGLVVKEVNFMVFNQWGQKVFETRSQTQGWDGNWKGKPQPSGVYIYVCKVVLTDGSTQTKKGSINLVR